MWSEFPKGVYPVMLTPFDDENKVDYESLGKLVEWYIENGAAGLFADCQSSEIFFLSLEERVEIARFVKEKAAGRVPVIASGHISEGIDDQAIELNAVAQTGVNAVILLTNRIATEAESDEIWLENLKGLLSKLPEDLPLGFYECPYPYKRIISPQLLKWCANSGRFYFIKDTSCDLKILKNKMEVIKGSRLQLFNANTSTLLETLQMGCGGFSGVMANFHPDIYSWICKNYKKEPDKAREIADFLTVASMIERQVYPINAKYYQKEIRNFSTIHTRVRDVSLLNETAKQEVNQLIRFTDFMRMQIL